MTKSERRLVGLLAALVLMLCLNGAEAKDNYKAYGFGASSCGAWTKSQANRLPLSADNALVSFDQAGQISWVMGFLSAYNYYQSEMPDVADSTDVNGMFSWIDNYCATHPIDNIATAALALISELSSRQH